MIINALKWLIKFIETRFPEKTNLNDLAPKELLAGEIRRLRAELVAENEKMQKQIEILNLRVGLTRATQSPFGRKLNG